MCGGVGGWGGLTAPLDLPFALQGHSDFDGLNFDESRVWSCVTVRQ